MFQGIISTLSGLDSAINSLNINPITFYRNRQFNKTVNYIADILLQGGKVCNTTMYTPRLRKDGSLYVSRSGRLWSDVQTNFDEFVLYDVEGNEVNRFHVDYIAALGIDLNSVYAPITYTTGKQSFSYVDVSKLSNQSNGLSQCGNFKAFRKHDKHGEYFVIEAVCHYYDDLTNSEISELVDTYNALTDTRLKDNMRKQYPNLLGMYN